ncbi:MAG TPA: CheR family methyltransferase, partial [Verrucomicrobiae bacterium]|nr:CheR family methyltransferase [Verrucomicrobiae bacterium]
ALLRLVFLNWLPRHRVEPLRLLSLPCASGEEPYSMAMTLLDAGVAPHKFQIDAVDISARALDRAKAGVYSRHAFRTKDLRFRERYFRSAPNGYALRPAVRERVRFSQGNVLDWGATEAARYHCIFCRNLLIYLDEASQAKALSRIKEMLMPDGLLFVGPAEQVVARTHGFVSGEIPMSLSSPRRLEPKRVAVNNGSLTASVLGGESAPPPIPSRAHETGPASFQHNELEQARTLADAGQLREAALICETYLQVHRDSAAAYYLLGLIRDAEGQPTALDCYRRALYLDPGHHETLLHMAFLAERSGDPQKATILRRRAQRANPRGAES